MTYPVEIATRPWPTKRQSATAFTRLAISMLRANRGRRHRARGLPEYSIAPFFGYRFTEAHLSLVILYRDKARECRREARATS